MEKLKHSIKLSLLIGAIISISEICEAKSLDGYIITLKNDTINGIVDVPNYNPRSGTYYRNNINLEMCFIQITFRKSTQEKNKTYKPEEIKEYGFHYKDVPFKFKSFLITKNSLSITDEKKYHFLLYTYDNNKYEIYKHQTYINEYDKIKPTYTSYILNDNDELDQIK